MLGALTKFFESYRDGWDSFNGDAIASHYRVPSTIIDMDGLHTYVKLEDIAEKFQSNCQLYKELGYNSATFVIGTYISNGDNAATIDIGWRVKLGADLLDFRTTYMCALTENQWFIVSAVAYEGPFSEKDT